MKRTFGIIAALCLIMNVSGQKSIDALFNKYGDSDGFVTFTISGNLLSLIKACEKDKNDDNLPGKISQIRILAQEDEGVQVDNFYDQIMKDLNVNEYDELMRVRESHQDLRMLVKTDGKIIKEFLLIGGGDDNVVIQIKGEITLEEAKDFSSDLAKDNGRHILSDLE